MVFRTSGLVVFAVFCLLPAAAPPSYRYVRTEQGLRTVEARLLQARIGNDRATSLPHPLLQLHRFSMKGELRTRADVFAGIDRPRDYVQKLAVDRVSVKGDTGAIARAKNIITDAAGNRLLEIRFTDTFIYEEGGGSRWRRKRLASNNRLVRGPISPSRRAVRNESFPSSIFKAIH